MKSFLALAPLALLAVFTSPMASAQTAAAKPAAKAAAKPAANAGKPAGKTTKLTTAQKKALEEAREIDGDPAVKLTEADLAIAKQVHVGDIPCELGATVHVTRHKRDGFFVVRTGIQRFQMHPVESRTGAIRLEDPVAGAMWLQLGNKSMLMSQKIGKRLADDCMNSEQSAMNETLKKNPINILEAPPVKVVAPAAPAESPAAVSGTVAAPAPATPDAAPAAPAATDVPVPASTPAGTAPALAPAAAPAATTN